MVDSAERPPELPLRAAVQAGFELTTRKWWLLAFPLLLDSFLWLGPRLSIQPLLGRLLALLSEVPQPAGTTNVQTLAALEQMGGVYNLFVQLSPSVLGVPILIKGMALDMMPLTARIVPVEEPIRFLGLLLVLTLGGLLYSTLYFDLMAQSLKRPGAAPARALHRLLLNYLQLVGLACLLLLLLCLLAIPTLMLTTISALFSVVLAQFVIVGASFLVITALIYLLFTLHGIFYAGQSFWRAAYDSWRIVRHNGRTTLWLLLLLIGVSFLLDVVWRALENGGWFTIVPVFAHAFVQTALLVASLFIYVDRAARLPVTARPILT